MWFEPFYLKLHKSTNFCLNVCAHFVQKVLKNLILITLCINIRLWVVERKAFFVQRCKRKSLFEHLINRDKKRRKSHLFLLFNTLFVLLRLTNNDRLVLWYESLHDRPSNQVCQSANAEYYHVAGLLAFKAHECKGFTHSFRVSEECTSAFVDEE